VSRHLSLLRVHISSSPFPPPGPCGSGSPGSSVLRLAPTPRHSSRVASFPSVSGTTLRPLAMQGRRTRLACAEFGYRSAAGLFTWKCRGLPGSWGVRCMHALLYDPGEAGTIRSFDGPVLPSEGETSSALAIDCFGAESHGLHAGCLRFAAGVAPMPRKTRFRLGTNLHRAGLSTRGTPLKVSDSGHSFSFSKLAWRTSPAPLVEASGPSPGPSPWRARGEAGRESSSWGLQMPILGPSWPPCWSSPRAPLARPEGGATRPRPEKVERGPGRAFRAPYCPPGRDLARSGFH